MPRFCRCEIQDTRYKISSPDNSINCCLTHWCGSTHAFPFGEGAPFTGRMRLTILEQNRINEVDKRYEFAESANIVPGCTATSPDLRFAPATLPKGEGIGVQISIFRAVLRIAKPLLCVFTQRRGSFFLFFNSHQLVNSTLVAFVTGKVGFQPGVCDLQSQHLTHNTGANGHHVGVIVLPGQTG